MEDKIAELEERVKKLEQKLAKIYWEAEQGLLPNSIARMQSWAIIELIGQTTRKLGGRA